MQAFSSEKGIFDPYVLRPFDKTLIFELVMGVRTRDYTVDAHTANQSGILGSQLKSRALGIVNLVTWVRAYDYTVDAHTVHQSRILVSQLKSRALRIVNFFIGFTILRLQCFHRKCHNGVFSWRWACQHKCLKFSWLVGLRYSLVLSISSKSKEWSTCYSSIGLSGIIWHLKKYLVVEVSKSKFCFKSIWPNCTVIT